MFFPRGVFHKPQQIPVVLMKDTLKEHLFPGFFLLFSYLSPSAYKSPNKYLYSIFWRFIAIITTIFRHFLTQYQGSPILSTIFGAVITEYAWL
jgi:hypothetical protein